jgi:hypothetical protein
VVLQLNLYCQLDKNNIAYNNSKKDFGVIFKAIFGNLVVSSLFNFVSFMFLK